MGGFRLSLEYWKYVVISKQAKSRVVVLRASAVMFVSVLNNSRWSIYNADLAVTVR